VKVLDFRPNPDNLEVVLEASNVMNGLEEGFEWLIKKIQVEWDILNTRVKREIEEWKIEKEEEKRRRRERIRQKKDNL
jgi:hypothetical protein